MRFFLHASTKVSCVGFYNKDSLPGDSHVVAMQLLRMTKSALHGTTQRECTDYAF